MNIPLPGAEDLPFSIRVEPYWLLLTSPHPLNMLSWAIHGGGPVTASRVAWHTVTDADLPPDVDPAEVFRSRLTERAWEDAVGLLTSRAVETFRLGSATVSGVRAVSIFTVDLGNAERIGSPGSNAPSSFQPGTINSFTWVSEPLEANALIEALAMSVQARTLTLLERAPGAWATGTGTDCAIIACPPGESTRAYAGLHTPVAHAIGQSVAAALGAGIDDWCSERFL